MNVISGQAGPGESEEPSYTFWKQRIPASIRRRLWVRVPPSLQDCHLAQLGRARNYTFVAGYVMSLITVEDESYFSLLSSGSWVRVPQWLLKIYQHLKLTGRGDRQARTVQWLRSVQ